MIPVGLLALGIIALVFAGRPRTPTLREVTDTEAATLAVQALEGNPPERNLLIDRPSKSAWPSVFAEVKTRLAKRGVRLTVTQQAEFEKVVPVILDGGF